MAINKKLRAWVRYDGKNRVVAGSLILQPHKPKDGKWKELPVYKCCNPSTSIDLPLFLSRMNSCYTQVTDLVPSIVYFGDGNGDPGLPNYIGDGCDDMYDDGNMYNTNLTQLYADIKEDNMDYDLNIPYTHTQDGASYNICNYTNPPIDGTINIGDSYFGSGSTYFTNMYPGMFIVAATGVNVNEFSITGDLGSDGDGVDAVYIATAHPGWTAFIKTNTDPSGDPSVNHIILVNGDVAGVTQLYDNTGAYDDHCLQGLSSQNSSIITAIVSTSNGTPALTEQQALAIANKILDVYNDTACVPVYTLRLLFDDIANANTLVGDASVVGDWNTFFDLPAYGNPFTSVVIVGNEVQLTGGSNIEVKFRLFNDYDHLLEVDDDGALVILGDESFGGSSGYSTLTSIIAPNVTTIIGDSANYGAFGLCYNLINVYLPNCVNLGACAFYDCEYLPQSGLTLAFDQITIIEDYTFNFCDGLTEVNYPAVTEIGHYAFESCGGITSIDLPVTFQILDQSFSSSTSLTSINIPNVTNIGAESFINCTNVTTFSFPLAQTLGYNVFVSCNAATIFNLSSCTNLGGSVFDDSVFLAITGNTITLTVPSALMTCNSGSPDGDIQYLQANNTVTIITV